MRFMQKLKNGFARLMYGRNGVDQLGMATIWACLILDIVSMFLQRRAAVAAAVLYWAAMVLWVLAIFRMFSKNLYKRREVQGCKTICRVPVGKGSVEITCPKCGMKIHGKT